MVGRLHRQSSLFYVAFEGQASLIKDDLLEPIDALLDDEMLIELVAQSLGSRRPRSKKTGRMSIAPDRLLRCCVLKQIKGWSFRELEREVRSSLVYRRFTRFDQDPIPKFSTFSRSFAAFGDDLTHQIHHRVVELARRQGVARGRRLRTDTTVVESNVHYPTDSSLLQDGVRVLTRSMKRIAEECAAGSEKVVDHASAAKHRALEITRAAKSFTEASQTRLLSSYRSLVGIVRSVVRRAQEMRLDIAEGRVKIVGDVRRVCLGDSQLEHFTPLVERVIAQTRARVFGGDTHVAGKVLSLFEPHTQVIRKGKAHKPTEFGRVVRIDEIEHGIVSEYAIKDGNPADVLDFLPAVSQHKKIFGRAPHTATADRGFFSARNEREARNLGVARVALPARGRLSVRRGKAQKERWFRRALRWRGGIEARIGTLKHRFGMDRARYKGDEGFSRGVGWSVIANNLVAIARQGVAKSSTGPTRRVRS